VTDTLTNAIRLAPTTGQKFRGRVLPFILFALVLVAIPFFGPSRTTLNLLNTMGINIVFALSFNMLLGRAGLLTFGHAVYLGLGGYFSVHVMNWIGEGTGLWSHLPVFALPVFGFAAGALAGAVIGWPSCKRSGTPFAMISLGVAELVASAGFMFDSLFGGEMGISADRMSGPRAFGLSLGPVGDVYWFIAFWTFVGVVGMYAFTRTPLGKLSEATRDNAERVQFIGFNPTRVRYLVFIFAGGFAGMAGGMSAVQFEIFTPIALSLIPSGFVLIMAYIGGVRYFAGPILGAILLTYMQSNLSDFSEAWLLYLGVLFIAVVMFAPGGIAGIVFTLWAGLTGPKPGTALKKFAGMLAGVFLLLLGLIVAVEVAVCWSSGGHEEFAPFGLVLEHDGILAWVLAVVPGVAGAGLLRWLNPNEERRT
jgi:branched-chain amino acid transport system permease protein